MKLDAYFKRIGYSGTPRVDVETLTGIHRRHLLAIPYENIDVQLGRPVDLDARRSFAKIVEQGRGGWCYEMNGLLEWALKDIGFDVMRVNGGVHRATRGDDMLGNHLVLLVKLDETWLVDTGFGDGIIDPVPLREGSFRQRGFDYRLEKLPDGYWRFYNHQYGGAPSFDFSARAADEELFRQKCLYLQSSPESSFVLNFICQRFVPHGFEIQLGRTCKSVQEHRVDTWTVETPEQLYDRLLHTFGLDVPEVKGLWPRIVERHNALFGP